MEAIHNRNTAVFEKVEGLLTSSSSNFHLDCLKIINDIFFLPHSLSKTAKVIAEFSRTEHIERSKKINFSSQSFYHHSAINMDEPEIFEAVETLFPQNLSSRGYFPMKYYIEYSGPKWRCFEHLSDAKLEKYLNFDGAQFRNLVSVGGIDRMEAFILSRGETTENFEASKLLFRSYDGEVPFPLLIVGKKRSELQTENLKYLLSTTEIPIRRVFENVLLVAKEPQFLIPGEISIKPDRLLEILEYSAQEEVTDLFLAFENKKIDLLLKVDEDTTRRFKYLNYLLNSDSGFQLLMKHRQSLFNVLSFNFSRSVDGLPIHKVRRFFKFIGATKTGCAIKPKTNETNNNDLDERFLLSRENIKLSKFAEFSLVTSEIDLLPIMGNILISLIVEKNLFYNTSPFTTFAKNIGLYEIWFQENPMSMLNQLDKSKILESYFKHRFTSEQLAAIPNGNSD